MVKSKFTGKKKGNKESMLQGYNEGSHAGKDKKNPAQDRDSNPGEGPRVYNEGESGFYLWERRGTFNRYLITDVNTSNELAGPIWVVESGKQAGSNELYQAA